MREYWFIYERYAYMTGCGFRKGWVQKGVKIVAKNKAMAINKFNEQNPDCRILSIRSYGVYLKL